MPCALSKGAKHVKNIPADSDFDDDSGRGLVPISEPVANVVTDGARATRDPLPAPPRWWLLGREMRAGADRGSGRGAIGSDMRSDADLDPLRGRKRGTWCDHEAGEGGRPFQLIAHARLCSMAKAIAWARAWAGGETSHAESPRGRVSSQAAIDRRLSRDS